ncbi:MAG: NAD-dependent epimerase/dehydratase family protein, partial [Methanobacterium paludis]|nr:NAD-dependent epimerase/dehydratase family protein [Methanobacterium paludis]
MKLGITGANGFIGKHLISSLKDNYEFETFNRQIYNLLNVKSMQHFVEDKDIIIHLAGANREQNEELIKINTLGTINLLEAIRKYSKIDTKVIYASSLQIYGFTNKLTCLDESTPTKPDSIYGISKKTAEELLNHYSKNYDIKTVIFRMSNLYGPGCKPYYNSVIATFIELIKNKENITINGTGEQCRDFIYISDVVNAFLTLLKQDFNTDTFNICTGKPTTINEIINIIKEITKISTNIQYNETDEKDNFLIGNPLKVQRILGY